MKYHEYTISIVSMVMGAFISWMLTIMSLTDHHVELSQRELVLHGFAYYTNGPSGYPVFKMKDAK